MIVNKKIKPDELVVQLKAQKKYAFSVLYNNYSPALLAVATNIVRNKQVAEDLIQEVFVKIWRNIDSYDPTKGTLYTWMLTITTNASKDYLRSKQYRHQLCIAGNGLDSIENYTPIYQTNYREERNELPQLIQNLDVKYREIIDLVYIYGYTQVEVAQILKIPSGTVKTRCRFGLQKLKSNYTESYLRPELSY